MSIMDLTAVQISKKVRSGEIKAKQVAEEAIKLAKQTQSKLNAFITISEEMAMAQADAVDKKVSAGKDPGLLAGVPVPVKDILLTKGVKTTAASKILENFVPMYSSTVVNRLEAEGALIIGKTNLDEFAMGASNENSAFGPVKNPWDLTRVPGGSSGGSAAVVAARISPVSIGTDTGGSIREPASFCGIVGVKPTYGRVSRYGVVAFASSLDQVGPFGVNVEDAALTLQVISGKDPLDSTSATVSVPNYVEASKSGVKGLRVGIPKEYFIDGIEKETLASVQKAIQCLKDAGATLVDISLPHTPYGVAVYYIVAPCEASANLSRYDGIRFGYRAKNASELRDLYMQSRGTGFGAEPKRRIMLGTFALSSGYYDAYYKKACQVRRLIRDDYVEAFKKCDIIATPVTTGPAFKLGDKAMDPMQMYLNDIFTLTPSLAGIPGASVNCGFTKEGLPIGVQLLAKPFDEVTVLKGAQVIEQSLGLSQRRPNGI